MTESLVAAPLNARGVSCGSNRGGTFCWFLQLEFLPEPEGCIVVGFGAIAPPEDACYLLDGMGTM
jgi:hypothetical protein